MSGNLHKEGGKAMEPVLGGGPGWTGSSGQGGQILGQANPANQSRRIFGIGKKEGTHECNRRTI